MCRTIVITLAVACLTGCARHGGEPELGEVHPSVFAMVPCWLSDTAEPVLTEINLDAVARNRNQFDKSAIKHDGEWIRIDTDQGQGYQRYRVLEAAPPRYKVEFEDAGGSSVWACAIEMEVVYRMIPIDGSRSRIRVMRVMSIEHLP